MLRFKDLVERVNDTRSLYLEQDKKLIKAKDNDPHGSYPAHHDYITHDTYGDAGEEATSAHHKFASERAPVHTFKHEGSTHKIFHHPNGSTIHKIDHTHGHHGNDIMVYSGHHDPKHIEKQEKKYSITNEEVETIDELSVNTVRGYYNKAGEQGKKIADKMKMGGGDWSKDGSDTKTLKKRAAGRNMALKRRSGEVKMSEDTDLEEGRMKDLAMGMESLSHADFKKKHKRTKQEMQSSLKSEALKGNQHKIDANKNGKVDGHDFKILRNAKKARYQ